MHDLITKIVLRSLRALVGGRSGYGKVRWQKLYTGLYDLSLLGMNVGTGSDLEESGEVFCLAYVQKKVPKNETLCFFDVGANVGEYSAKIIALFDTVVVHAFEPSTGAFNKLTERFGDTKNVILHNFGLSDKEGEVCLYADMAGSGMASIYKRRLDHFDVKMDVCEKITLETLDAYCRSNGIGRIHFLKIDVEGNEIKVLEGARRMMAEGRIDLIQFEFGGTDIDSRTFLQDFYYLLKDDYTLYRILKDGLYPMDTYAEKDELFIATNFLAERKSVDASI